MIEATGKVYWELYELSKIVEKDTELDKRIEEYSNLLDTIPTGGWTRDDMMNFIKQEYKRYQEANK